MQSSLQKTVIILILLVLLAGVALLWWMFSPNTPAASDISQPGTSLGGFDNETDIPVSSSTPGQSTASTVDIEAAYASLFSKIGATKVDFTPVTASSTGDLASLYKLYAKDVAAEQKAYPNTPAALDVALVDLTDDGTPEALVYERLPDYCGTGGCAFDIYKKSGGLWTKIYSTLVGGDVGLSNTLTSGHLDLFLTAEGNPGVARYTWSGKTYELKEVMALWTGTEFQTAS